MRDCFKSIFTEKLFYTIVNVVAVLSVIAVEHSSLKLKNFRRNRKIKDELSGLSQFLATKGPLKMMKNAFYFAQTSLFALKIFKFLPCLFRHLSKRFDEKD